MEQTHHKPQATFYEMTGMLLAREHRSYHVGGTPEHVWKAYTKIQKHNLLLGWWSLYALVINPFLLIANTIAWFGFKRDYQDYLYNPDAFQARQQRRTDRKYKSEHRSPWTVIKWTFIIIGGFFLLMVILLLLTA